MSDLTPEIQKIIDDLCATFPLEVAATLRTLPICTMCQGNLPGGRPRDPDGVCEECAANEADMYGTVEIDGYATDDNAVVEDGEQAGSTSRVARLRGQ